MVGREDVSVSQKSRSEQKTEMDTVLCTAESGVESDR